MKKYYYTPIISHHEIRLNTTIMSGEKPGASGDNGGDVPPGTTPTTAPGRTLYI